MHVPDLRRGADTMVAKSARPMTFAQGVDAYLRTPEGNRVYNDHLEKCVRR